MSTKPQKKMYTTPVGVVGAYPYLQRPDKGNEKFPKPRGEWSCKLLIPSAQAQKVVDLIVKASEANYQNYLENIHPKRLAEAKAKGKRPPKQLDEAQYPFYEDDQGNVVFTFKSHASYQDKSGETKEITLRVYDCQGKRIQVVPNICNGSEGRVEFSLVPYVSEVANVGIKLQLEKFQLLKLKEWTGNDTFGGGAVEGYEDGFKADEFGGEGTGFEDHDYSDDEPAGGTAQDYHEDTTYGDF